MVLSQVRQINGVEVNNLAKLVEVAEACKTKYIRVELDYNQASSPDLALCPSEPLAILHSTAAEWVFPATR